MTAPIFEPETPRLALAAVFLLTPLVLAGAVAAVVWFGVAQ